MIRKLIDRARRIEVGLLFSLFLVSLLLLAFGLVAGGVMEGGTLAFDRSVILMFREEARPGTPIGPTWLQEGARDLTSLGSFLVIGIILALAVVYLLLAGKRTSALLLLAAVLGGAAINTLLKIGVARPRPEFIAPTVRVFTPSFPSGHAALAAVSYLTLAALLARTAHTRRLRVFFITTGVFLALAVGISRIYLGVHYPTDVFAGWFIGSAWALLCWSVMRSMQQRGQVPPAETGRDLEEREEERS